MRSIGLALLVILSGCAAPAPRSSAASSSSPEPTDGISRNEAVEVASDALPPVGEDWDVVLAEAGPLGRVSPGWEEPEWGRGLSADQPVWRVVMVAGEMTAEVILDFLDGSVYGSVMSRSTTN